MKDALQPFQVLPPEDLAAGMKEIFLRSYQECGTAAQAAETAGIPVRLAYTWRVRDKKFAEEWDNITYNQVLPHLEQVAIERAKEKSDLLLMFLLKSMNRKRYDDKQIQPERDNTLKITLDVVKPEPAQEPHGRIEVVGLTGTTTPRSES